ncbi:MAG: restriction endonuclease [Thermoanaerobaculaceae bacterium]|nr:restriction endonuclease [Thermoanaerobaculaceae bacterium]
MKFSPFFRDSINCNSSEEVFSYLINTLKESITKWDYFVNWNNVFSHIKDLEISLNILNYLIGKENIEEEFRNLLKKHPEVANAIPLLVACRKKNFNILKDFKNGEYLYENYSFDFKNKKSHNEDEINKIVEFAKEIGLLALFQSRRIKNCLDYLIGVEVGLDSNARKNRGGAMMEDIVEFYIAKITQRRNYQYIKQATADKVRDEWNKVMTIDKSSRRIDFAVFKGDELILIETNFYAGGGSKLKSTAGEYRTMFDFWSNDGHKFIWITDGYGWKKAKKPLEETFNHIDYLLNLEMVAKGLLEKILCE